MRFSKYALSVTACGGASSPKGGAKAHTSLSCNTLTSPSGGGAPVRTLGRRGLPSKGGLPCGE